MLTLTTLGAANAETETLAGRAMAEIRRCATLALSSDCRTPDIYARRALRLADLLAAGPQGGASLTEGEKATAALQRELM